MEHSRAIDLITLQDELLRNASLESAGGIGYLSGLLEGIPHLVNIDHYIDIIRDKSLLRQMISSASKIMIAECFDQAEPADAILDQAEQALFNLSEHRTKSGFVSVRDMEEDTQKLLTKLYEDKEMITGVATGFTDLDRMTSGFQPGDLVILAARPSMGKTALALNVAQYVALEEGLARRHLQPGNVQAAAADALPLCGVACRCPQGADGIHRQGRFPPVDRCPGHGYARASIHR